MPSIFDQHLLQTLALTGGLAASTTLAHRVALRRIAMGRCVLTPAERRRVGWARAAATLVLLAGTAALWWTELQALMLSLTAVLVALVIASKELIQCATGSLLGGLRGRIRVGDVVEIAGVRGEVVERSLLTTSLVETDETGFPHDPTGRVVVVPNVQLFAGPLRRRRSDAGFVFHRIGLIVDRGPGTAEMLHVWRSEAARLCEPFEPRAADARRTIEAEIGASLGARKPRTRLSTTELGKLRFDAEVFCPADQAAHLEAQLTTTFLDWLSARSTILGFGRRLDTANANAASEPASRVA